MSEPWTTLSTLELQTRLTPGDRIPDEQDIDDASVFVDPVVEMVAGLRHENAPDDAAASSGVLLALLIGSIAELGDDGSELLHE